jgi:hypothetical protein
VETNEKNLHNIIVNAFSGDLFAGGSFTDKKQ